MSGYTNKAQNDKTEKKSTRDTSIVRRSKKEDSEDGRPIITQVNPSKSKSSSSTTKLKIKTQQPEKMLSMEKIYKKKSEVETKRITKHEPLRVKREADVMYFKEILDKQKLKKGKPITEEDKRTKKKLGENERVENSKRNKIEYNLKKRRDRTRTRTLSPTEVKQLIPSKMAFEMASGDKRTVEDEKMKMSKIERNMNETQAALASKYDDYEDDFEDYESDFEQEESENSEPEINISSTPDQNLLKVEPLDSEPKTDSPNPTDSWKLKIQNLELENIKKSVEKENLDLIKRRLGVPSLTAFKTNRQILNSASNVEVVNDGKIQKEKTQENEWIIDFSAASKKQKNNQAIEAAIKRGQELLSMISLDAITYNIFEIPAIPYDEFMKTFGKSNSKQICIQTNEDDLEEEIQTDKIVVQNKWTQFPPEYLGSKKIGSKVSYILTKEERLGVGSDPPEEEKETEIVFEQKKTTGLSNFLSYASQLVLSVMERKSGNFLNLENMPNHSKAMAIGDGFVYLKVNEISFLKDRSVTHLCHLPKNIGKLLSVHLHKDKYFQRSMICIWNFQELSKPFKILIASNRIISCTFGPNQGNLVFAGLSDGSICVWDLREPSTCHSHLTINSEWSLQSPTYTTAGDLKESTHSLDVVAIKNLQKEEEELSGFGDFTPLQICSLDKNGTIAIWSVTQIEKAQKYGPSEDLGLAHWGKVKLVKSSSFSVFDSLKEEIPNLYITCNDILINEEEGNSFYIANSLGSVNFCSQYGFMMKPKFFVPAKHDFISEAICLELCPFNKNYFLVGCEDGTIRLHSRHQENPLITLNCNVVEKEGKAGINSIIWMQTRPCVFFALDSKSRIHIWNLGVSDIYPEISLFLTEKKILCMKLLPTFDPRQIPFIVIGTEGGSVEIHRLKKEYGCRSASDVEHEMKMFLKYVSIL